eukprot:gene22043-29109_t
MSCGNRPAGHRTGVCPPGNEAQTQVATGRPVIALESAHLGMQLRLKIGLLPYIPFVMKLVATGRPVIALECAHLGMRLRLKSQLAGRLSHWSVPTWVSTGWPVIALESAHLGMQLRLK